MSHYQKIQKLSVDYYAWETYEQRSIQLPKTLEHLRLMGISFDNMTFFSNLTHLTSLELLNTNASNNDLAKNCLELQSLQIES